MLDVVAAPGNLWQFISAINVEGWYTIGHGFTPSGAVLWLLWAIEAAIVVAGTAVVAPARIRDRAFGEDCGTWMADEPPLAIPADAGAPSRHLSKGGLGALQEPAAPATGGARWLVLQRQRCDQC